MLVYWARSRGNVHNDSHMNNDDIEFPTNPMVCTNWTSYASFAFSDMLILVDRVTQTATIVGIVVGILAVATTCSDCRALDDRLLAVLFEGIATTRRTTSKLACDCSWMSKARSLCKGSRWKGDKISADVQNHVFV